MASDSPFPPGSRLVAYLRDSGGVEQELSVAQQEAEVRAWCSTHQLTLSRVFADQARTGTRTAGREQFLEMMGYFSSAAPERGVLLWDYSRLARNFDDSMLYLADLRRQGYTVYSLQDRIPDTLDGRLFETILAWKNAKFIQDLSRNVKRGMAYNARVNHAWQHGHPPAGYVMAPKVIGSRRDGKPHSISILTVDPGTAERVKLAFRMRLEGHTIDEIHAATRLYHTRRGYLLMLHNPIYVGLAVQGEETIPGFCEPIVDQATWDAVQALYPDGGKIKRAKTPYLLSGLVRCLVCGRLLSGLTSTRPYGTYAYYRCTGNYTLPRVCQTVVVSAPDLEQRVLARTREYLSDDSIQERVSKEALAFAQSTREHTDQSLVGARAELRQVNGSISRLVAAIRDAGHSPAILADLASQELRHAELTQAIATAEAKERTHLAQLPDPGEIRDIYLLTLSRLESDDRRRLQLVLRSFIKEIRCRRSDSETQGNIVFITPIGTEIEMEL